MAQSGTIFLDELGELSVDLQPKLLRVLEQREVRRVGSNKPIPIDVRVIAATNRDLEAEVKAGRFREDLFYRLSVVRVLLPPLRERKEDISLLVHHFLREHRYNRDRDDQLKIRHIAPQALRALEAYRWPGNIRELVNVIERACSFAEGDTIEPRDLPEGVLMAAGALLAPPAHPVAAAAAPSLEEAHDFPTLPPGMITPARLQEKAFKEAKEEWISAFEKDYIVALLERNQHNISHAAREAEIDRKYFRKLMKKYGIEGGADVGEE
jgi:DNA-binding NtrC family response regulator